jgi:hypothetical protein
MDGPTLLVLAWLACSPVGAYLAQTKGRSGRDGAIVGAAFGPVGILVIARAWPRPERPTPSALASDWLVTAVTILIAVVIAVLVFRALAVGLQHMCPSGQHPEGGQGGSDITCEYDH